LIKSDPHERVVGNGNNLLGSEYLGFVQFSNKGIMRSEIQALMLSC